MLHALLHPKLHQRDVRHQSGKGVIDLSSLVTRADQTFGLENKANRVAEIYHHAKDLKLQAAQASITLPQAYEKCGVSHLVHGWSPQGHPVGIFPFSK